MKNPHRIEEFQVRKLWAKGILRSFLKKSWVHSMLSDNGILGSWMVLNGSIWWKISIQHWNNKWTNKTLIRTISSLLDGHLWLPYPIPSHFSSYFSCHIPRTHCIFIYLFFLFYLFIFSFIFVSWRLITSQHFSGFCYTLTWIS